MMGDYETWFQINFVLKPVIQATGARKHLGGSCNDFAPGLTVYRSLCDSWLAGKTAHIPTIASASFRGQVGELSAPSLNTQWPLPPPVNHRAPLQNSPLQRQAEPAPFYALWFCVSPPPFCASSLR